MGANQYAPPRAIRIVGEVAYVPLTRGHEAIIDASDAPLLSSFKWCARTNGRTLYAARGAYDAATKRSGTIYMHRVLMAMPAGMIDHINGDGLDNRRSNLRLADHKENGRNCRLPTHNTSGHKGVSFKKAEGKWRAQIKVNGKRLHLGQFRTAEEASEAYRAASRQLHGNFGRDR